MGDENAPHEFGAVFQGAIDKVASFGNQEEWRHFWAQPVCSCGVTLFADDVFEKGLLEMGTADECEHKLARRMGEVNSALETCGLRQNAGKLVILPNLRRTVENRKFSRRKQEHQIKASHRFLGTVYPAMLSMGAEIDQRIWATNRAWRELCGMWWNMKMPYKSNGRSFPALFAEPPSRVSRHFSFMTEMLGEKATRSHARHGLLRRTRPHKDSKLSPSVG